MTINVILNGEKRELNIEPDEFLAETLRRYGCKSVKVSCNDGACGSCTVILNGKPVLSCEYLSVRADGNTVLTDEGLGEEGKKIVECLVSRGGEGCGYCAPGFVVLTYAMKKEFNERKIEPTTDNIREYLNGNLCRCTGYQVRVEAAMEYLKM